MKYSCEVTINLPRNKVIDLFDNPDNMAKWQPGLREFKHVSGEPGKPGAKSSLTYDMNGRSVKMVETVTSRNLPDEFSGTYEADGVYNVVENYFYESGAGKTRWVTENEFKFTGFMRLMAIFIGGAFRKETLNQMNNFKTFAESGV